MRRISDQSGFTLVEMIIVIAITASSVRCGGVPTRAAGKLHCPGPPCAAGRHADTALRRIGRDIRLRCQQCAVTSDARRVSEFLAPQPGYLRRRRHILIYGGHNSFDILAGYAMQASDRIAVTTRHSRPMPGRRHARYLYRGGRNVTSVL